MATEKTSPTKHVDPKVQEILDRLDLKAQDPSLPKITNRWRYRRPGMSITIEHPAGGTARGVCHARMIWREGIALLCPNFSYPGSVCTLVLVSIEGDLMSIRGTVELCRHIQAGYHEVELKFSQCIDPQMFVESSGLGTDATPNVEPSNLRARIIHLDDSEADAKLLAHHLRGSGIELISFRKAADALAHISSHQPFDIFLCDLNLGRDGDSLPVIRAVRNEHEFTGPIVAVTAESHPPKLAAVKEAGADSFLAKPFSRESLMKVIISLHHQVGAIAGEMLFSSLSDQPDIEELLASYIASVKETSAHIEAAIIAKDLDTVRSLCLNVKGTAAGYGFSPLSRAAEETIRVLDSSMGIDEARPKLRSLMLMTGQLALKSKSGATASVAKDRVV
jgi:CheY-like chemotaxis protein